MLRHEKTSFWQAYHKEAQEILKAGKVWLESDEAREMWGKTPDREDLYAFRSFQDSFHGEPTLIALDHYSGHYGECNPCDDATCGTQPACPTPPAYEGSGTQTGSLEEISIDTDADGRFYYWTKGDCLKDISAEKYL